MYCMSVSYPKSEDAVFDLDYYLSKHLPLVQDLFSEMGLQSIIVKTEVGNAPGKNNKLFASVDILFTDKDALLTALKTSGQKVTDDVVNFTSIAPSVLFSDYASFS